jgi:DNA-binding GntR family transcriptional regulator
MSNQSHCPFLNREDARCANHFSLDRLDHAFHHCFGSYSACPTYHEMLTERRYRQECERNIGASHSGLTESVVYANLTIRTRPAHVTVNQVRLSVPQATAA